MPDGRGEGDIVRSTLPDKGPMGQWDGPQKYSHAYRSNASLIPYFFDKRWSGESDSLLDCFDWRAKSFGT